MAVSPLRKVVVYWLILLIVFIVALYRDEVARTFTEATKIVGFAQKEPKFQMKDQLLERIEKRQTERRQHLRDYCAKHAANSKQRGTSKNPVIVNDDYKVIFCYVPKVACSQWKRVFLALDNRSDVTDVHDNRNFKFLFDYSDEDIEVRLKSYFKFLFVREPLERLLSAYENKFSSKKWPFRKMLNYKREILERYNQVEPGSDRNLTFKKFIYFVNDVGFDRNPHWASYGPLCLPCDIDYDFIGHFEDMPEEAPFILRLTGMDRVATFPAFVTHNTTSKLLKNYGPIPKEMITELGKAFQEDFEMFNYDFPGPLSNLMRD